MASDSMNGSPVSIRPISGSLSPGIKFLPTALEKRRRQPRHGTGQSRSGSVHVKWDRVRRLSRPTRTGVQELEERARTGGVARIINR